MEINTPEFKDLATDITEIAKSLDTYVGEISKVLSHLSIGDMTISVSKDTAFSGDFIPIKTALEKLIESLFNTFVETTNIMNHINQIGEKTNEISKDVADNEKLISEHMEVISDKARVVSKEADANSENVTKVSVNLKHALENVKTGSNNVKDLVEAMEQVRVASEQIAGITNMIFSISSRTKLLALNASIEAARAGEQGKGFAVVAGEIGKLAMQTTEAVEQTRGLIDNSVSKVQECRNVVEETENSFAAIKVNIENITEQSKDIVESTTKQKENIDRKSVV